MKVSSPVGLDARESIAGGSRLRIASAVVAITLALPGVAQAQCGESQGGLGGLFDSLMSIFRATKIEFEARRNGQVYSGEIEVKDASCGSTTLTVRTTAGVGTEAEGNRGPVGGGVTVTAGVANEYELTLPNRDWANTTAPPNPFDPASLPPGGSMVFRREFFASMGLEANYRALVAAAGYEEGAGVVVAVQRLENGQTRLMVGPYTVVKNEFMVGLGRGDLKVGLGRDDKLENGRLRSWTFDPSRPEDVRAYQLAMAQSAVVGAVPFADRPSDRVEYISYESLAGIRVQAGPISFGGNWGQSNGDVRVVTRPDGSRTYEMTSNYNGTILNVSREYDAQGRQIGEDKINVSFTRMSDWDAYMLDVATGGAQPGDNNWAGRYPGGMRLEFNNANWQEWRDRARAMVNDPRRIGSPPTHIQMIADAQGPMDVAMAMYRVGSGPYTRTFEDLFTLSTHDPQRGYGDVRPLPGAAGRGCPNATGNPGDAAADAQTRAQDVARRWCGSNVNLTAPTAAVMPQGIRSNGDAGPAIGAGMPR